jgi:hypothetical protein
MFVERKLNASTGAIELWWCDWEQQSGQPTKKIFVEKIGDEQPIRPDNNGDMTQEPAICWSYGRTLGNIAVFSPSILGRFDGKIGSNAVLPCDFVDAGKFRHGALRWWCRTHQSHWGIKADYESYERSRVMTCANHEQEMNYVVGPFKVPLNKEPEVGVWCSMPAAISTRPVPHRAPNIHVHVRPRPGEHKTVDRDFNAIAIEYGNELGLFGNAEITQVNITPPAAYEFVRALELDQEMSCINCSHCGFPHLYLGSFAEKPHRKHFCANCGRDSTWSSTPIVSTPLKPLHDQFAKNLGFENPSRTINLDEHQGSDFTLWASTPAVLWTAARPQEKGIHVHLHENGKRIVDDTFAEVILDGKVLVREELLQMMVSRTII